MNNTQYIHTFLEELLQQRMMEFQECLFFLPLFLFYFAESVGALFVSPKGRWQASEGGETPSMKTQIACVGKSDSEANAKRKLLPYRTTHC